METLCFRRMGFLADLGQIVEHESEVLPRLVFADSVQLRVQQLFVSAEGRHLVAIASTRDWESDRVGVQSRLRLGVGICHGELGVEGGNRAHDAHVVVETQNQN